MKEMRITFAELLKLGVFSEPQDPPYLGLFTGWEFARIWKMGR